MQQQYRRKLTKVYWPPQRNRGAKAKKLKHLAVVEPLARSGVDAVLRLQLGTAGARVAAEQRLSLPATAGVRTRSSGPAHGREALETTVPSA